MQLSGNTVRNLELFNNATDGQEKGSLFWTLNQTVTKSGARRFRSWLAKPLMCVRYGFSNINYISEIPDEC